jgi:hypothetical protein
MSTAKGKIARDQWPVIAARRRKGETFMSIAKTYGCTPPAIRYILARDPQEPRSLPSAEKKNASPDAVGPAEARAARDAGVGINSALRDRINGDIAAFLVAFDTVLDNNTPQTRRALIEATDRLMRAGARTRICLVG